MGSYGNKPPLSSALSSSKMAESSANAPGAGYGTDSGINYHDPSLAPANPKPAASRDPVSPVRPAPTSLSEIMAEQDRLQQKMLARLGNATAEQTP